MTDRIPSVGAHRTEPFRPTGANREGTLRDSAVQLEGMFVRQLFAAMRETVPQDGAFNGGAGEEMFTALMHEHIADALPASWDRGLAAQVAQSFNQPSDNLAGASRREAP